MLKAEGSARTCLANVQGERVESLFEKEQRRTLPVELDHQVEQHM